MAGEDLSVQALVIVGGVMGGTFSVMNAAIGLAKESISKRRNGNGHGNVHMIHDDIKIIDADLKECASKMNDLTRMADGFKRSHEMLKEILLEQTAANREFQKQFAVFLEKFGAHLQDFKCLRFPDGRE